MDQSTGVGNKRLQKQLPIIHPKSPGQSKAGRHLSGVHKAPEDLGETPERDIYTALLMGWSFMYLPVRTRQECTESVLVTYYNVLSKAIFLQSIWGGDF